MNNLGMIFIDRDQALAKRWLRKAAGLGHGMAAHTLAVIAMKEERDADMRAWLQRAATLGNERSSRHLRNWRSWMQGASAAARAGAADERVRRAA